MKLKTLGRPLLYNGIKVVELLAQDIRDIQERLAKAKAIAFWQVTSMPHLRESLWHLFSDHAKCEYILTKAHEHGLNEEGEPSWNKDVEVELFGVDSTKDYKDYIDTLITVFQGCPMKKVDNSYGILLSYDSYCEPVIDEDELQKWNNFTPHSDPTPISWNYEEPDKEQDEKIKKLSDCTFFKERLTPEHFVKPTKQA